MEMWESVMGTLDPHISSLVVESGWACWVCVLLLQEGSNSQLLCLPHKDLFKDKSPWSIQGRDGGSYKRFSLLHVDMDIQFGVYEHLIISPKRRFSTLSSEFWGDS